MPLPSHGFFRRVCSAVIVSLCLASMSPAADIQIFDGLVHGQKGIFINGPIEYGDDEKFYRIVEHAKPERASVVLISPGGNVNAGLGIGAEIALRGFTTLVLEGEGCYSICAVIWASGARRYMAPEAKIGVHAAYRLEAQNGQAPSASESGVANADIGAFLNEIGLSREAIRYFTTAGPDELKPITPEIARMLSIDVHIQDGFDVIETDQRPTPRLLARQSVDYLSMAQNCENLLGAPSGYYQNQGEKTLAKGHDLVDGEVMGKLIIEYLEPVKAEIHRQGFVRWCIDAERRLRGENKPTGITGPSFDCTKAATNTEVAICRSKDLWVLDHAMAEIYFFHRNHSSSELSRYFLDTQRDWIKRRNNCNGDTRCLSERYSSRIFDLGGL